MFYSHMVPKEGKLQTDMGLNSKKTSLAQKLSMLKVFCLLFGGFYVENPNSSVQFFTHKCTVYKPTHVTITSLTKTKRSGPKNKKPKQREKTKSGTGLIFSRDKVMTHGRSSCPRKGCDLGQRKLKKKKKVLQKSKAV